MWKGASGSTEPYNTLVNEVQRTLWTSCFSIPLHPCRGGFLKIGRFIGEVLKKSIKMLVPDDGWIEWIF